MWTSRATESDITVTAHYNSNDWILESPVLQTRPLYVSHTAANLAEVLVDATNEWDLGKPSDIALTRQCCKHCERRVRSRLCTSCAVLLFAHTVNLAVQRGMKVNDMSRLLGRVRTVLSFFHRSTSAEGEATSPTTPNPQRGGRCNNACEDIFHRSAGCVEQHLQERGK